MTVINYERRAWRFLLLTVPFTVLGSVNAILSPGVCSIGSAAFSVLCVGFQLGCVFVMRAARANERFGAQEGSCAYCGAEACTLAPDSSDDRAWDLAGRTHAADCRWVASRGRGRWNAGDV